MSFMPLHHRQDAAVPDGGIAVLVVDDSVVVRRIMTRVLEADPRFTVAGAVASGAQALELVQARPVDLVLLDVQMPGLDGMQVLPRLLDPARHIRVALLSGTYREGSELALRALAMGASDVVEKPSAGHFSDRFVARLLDRLAHLAGAAAQARRPDQPDAAAIRLRPAGTQVRALGIGASTGGISAILSVIGGFAAPLPFPLFITQHLPANFQPLFAEQLRRASGLPVLLAEDGQPVRAGAIHLAPGHAHLSLARDADDVVSIRLSREACKHGGVPAVDPMFGALARVYGEGACGVILSGMGRDGAAGALRIVEAGGWLIAQDVRSSAVWGMPGAVARAGLASLVLPPTAIAGAIMTQLRARP